MNAARVDEVQNLGIDSTVKVIQVAFTLLGIAGDNMPD